MSEDSLAQIAQDFRGQLGGDQEPEPEMVEEPATQAAAEPELTEDREDGIQDEQTATEQSDGEDRLPETLSEYAEATGMDMDYIYGLKIGLPGAGGEDITLGQWKDRVQELDRVQQGADQLERQRRELEQQAQHVQQQAGAAMQVPNEIRQVDAQILAIQDRFNNTNWAQLEQEDPGRAALQKQNLSVAYENAQSQRQNMVQQYGQQQEAQRAEMLQQQNGRLMEFVPEWRDPATRSQEEADIMNWAESEGLDKNSIMTIPDAGVVRFLRNQWLKSKKYESADENFKQVQKRPRSLRAGGGHAVKQASVKLDALIQRAKRPGASRQEKERAEIAVLRSGESKHGSRKPR